MATVALHAFFMEERLHRFFMDPAPDRWVSGRPWIQGTRGELVEMMWGYGDYGGWSWLMLLPMVLFWGGLLAVIVWAIYRAFPGQSRGSETGAEILERRFARGEIDAETYRAALREIGASRSTPSRDAR